MKEVILLAETGETYRCDVCGMVVEVKEAGGGELVCCDQPMEKVA
jgi:desulfoferrodoxin-like iron-binding protein